MCAKYEEHIMLCCEDAIKAPWKQTEELTNFVLSIKKIYSSYQGHAIYSLVFSLSMHACYGNRKNKF